MIVIVMEAVAEGTMDEGEMIAVGVVDPPPVSQPVTTTSMGMASISGSISDLRTENFKRVGSFRGTLYKGNFRN